ncbi:MAG TPA: nuclear transport factor 2 family protein [Sandaracinaceae bacterium]
MSDPLAIVKTSPELVARHDKEAWLALFSDRGRIEDPVGAGAYVGRARHSAFWDAFIAPNRVTFLPRRDFVSGDVVVRYVTISTITPVSDEPFALPALIEYVVEGGRIASLRAFWEPRLAVGWHAKKGARGLVGLTKHGLRMTGGLGIGAAVGFSRALVPSLSRAEGRALAARLAEAVRDRSVWLALTERARVSVSALSPHGGDHRDAKTAWDAALAGTSEVSPEEVIVAGDHLACVLAQRGGSRALAAIARVARGAVIDLRLIWS